MIKQLISFNKNHRLFNHSSKILVAVSGGIDSMVLLHLLNQLPNQIMVAHCNFKLRQHESDADELFVKNYCNKQQIQCSITSFNTEAFAISNKISIQEAARKLRYQWFNELLENLGFDHAAVAHNMNDVAETMLFNLARGTGIQGLSGINVKHNTVIRPLLFASRQAIINYAQEHAVPFTEDSSNASDKYSRNRIRHNIIPELEIINPRFIQNAYNSANILQQYKSFIEQAKSEAIATCVSTVEQYMFIRIAEFDKLHRILQFEILKQYGFNPQAINNIIKAMQGQPGKQFHSVSNTLVVDRENLIISRKRTTSMQSFNIIPTKKPLELPIPLSWKIIQREIYTIQPKKHIAAFDFDMLKETLTLRKWNDGDYFVPLGMTGKKKISDYFTDHKFSYFEKHETWLLCNGNDIIWIVNHRSDNRYKITNKTKTVIEFVYS